MKKERRGIRYGTVFFIVVATVCLTAISTYFYISHKVDNLSRNQQIYTKLNKVSELISKNYVLPIDPLYGMEHILDGIVDGYVDALGDEYSYYLSETNYRLSAGVADSSRIGIGVRTDFDPKTGGVRIEFVKRNSPAERAGLKRGDIITEIGGTSVTEIGYRNAVYSLSGAEYTDVILRLNREGEPQPLTLSVTRLSFEEKTVQYRLLESGIGYIFLNDFAASTVSEFSAAAETLRTTGAKGFILDVRFNGGGELIPMLDILDKIMPAGVMMTVEFVSESDSQVFYSDESCFPEKIVILQNAQTSDVAEVFAAALQDSGTATVVGDISRGKGVEQHDIPLSDGSAIHISTREYISANGTHINGVGVIPEIPASLSQEKLNSFYSLADADDDQLQAALQALRSQLGLS